MSESKAHQVEIREVDGQTLRKLVDYIYTAEIEVTEDNVQVRAGTFGGCLRGGRARKEGSEKHFSCFHSTLFLFSGGFRFVSNFCLQRIDVTF